MVRFKNRYITVEVSEDGSKLKTRLVNKDLAKEVNAAVLNLFGEFGLGAIRTGFSVVYCNQITRIAILRARHGPHKFVLGALPMMTKVGKQKVSIRTIHVGGTLRQCFRRIVTYHRRGLVSSKEKSDLLAEFENSVSKARAVVVTRSSDDNNAVS